MRFIGIHDSKEQPTVVTPWSYMHVVSGVLLFAVISCAQPKAWGPVSTFVIASLIHACYEAKDLYRSYGSQTDTNNSWMNSLGDQACATVGMFLAFAMVGRVCSLRDCLYLTLLATTTFLVFKTNRTNVVWD